MHYIDVIMTTMASQITSLTVVYSTVYSDAGQRKHQSSASLAFVWGIHRGPVNSPDKWPVTRKMFPFDDVIMLRRNLKRSFWCRSKKTSKLRVTGLCVGNSPGPVNSPHKGPVTRKMFPFDDAIMDIWLLTLQVGLQWIPKAETWWMT